MRCTRSNRNGSISILLALITTSCMVVFSVFLQAAGFRVCEAGLLRAARSSAEAALSAYCGVLLQRYGLFAIDTAGGGRWREQAEEIYKGCRPVPASGCLLEILAGGSLAERDRISEGIRRFVGERIPALLLATGLQRLAGFSRIGDAVPFDPFFDSGITDEDTDGWSAWIVERLEKDRPDSDGSPQAAGGEMQGLDDAMESLRECLHGIGTFNRESASDPQAVRIPSPLDPTGVSGFLGRMRESLPAKVLPIVDRMSVVVYAASMFRSRVTETQDDGVVVPLKDLRGRPHASLVTVEDCEIEGIVAGRESDEANAAAVERRLLAIRLALQMVAQAVDPESRDRARLLGETLSVLLSAASSGSISIPAGYLSAAIQIAWAFGAAVSEVQALVGGQGVPLLPQALSSKLPELANTPMFYGDYLILFLATLPQAILLERIAGAVQRNIALSGASEVEPGSPPLSAYCTTVRASTTFRGAGIGFTAGYGADAQE